MSVVEEQGRGLGSVALCLVLCWAGAAQAARGELSTRELKKLSLEELMNLEVTSVSRTPQTLASAPTAVTVVTNEDILRSGAATVPEALRWVPGIHVARRNSNSWAVSARGFSSVNSEKLLVLSDTRSIYTPLYSGVFWDVQDYLMHDIDRIEVIRGPGAALWGSNAVNGIINIITKSARETHGAYLEAGAGTEEKAFAAARYGGETVGGIHFRVFGKYFDRDDTHSANPVTADDWRLGHAGFRADWDATDADAFTLQGDLYSGTIGQNAPSISVIGRTGPQGDLEADVTGGNILGRWRRSLSADADMQLRIYYDRTHRDDPSFEDDLDTVDADFQHRFIATPRQEIVWGVNYRFTKNRNVGKGIFELEPPSSRDELISAFIQDQITLHDSLELTLGTKLEDNDFSGFEVQPSVRAAWDIAGGHMLWAAVSKAVRVPTRIERDLTVDASDPAGNPVVRLLGNEDFEAEELVAYELGYRWQPTPSLSLDVAAFHNRYDELASLEFGTPFAANGRTIIPIVNRNLTDGHAQGVELLAMFSPVQSWRLSASYSYLDLELDPGGADLNRGEFYEGATPRHQVVLRSFLDLPAGLQLDVQYRYSSELESSTEIVSGDGISDYSEVDVRVAWRTGDGFEVSVVGQNLLHDRHVEFGSPAARGEIERAVYGKIAWGF